MALGVRKGYVYAVAWNMGDVPPDRPDLTRLRETLAREYDEEIRRVQELAWARGHAIGRLNERNRRLSKNPYRKTRDND